MGFLNSIASVVRENRAKRHIKRGNYEKALDLVRQARRLDKNNFFPWTYFETEGIALYYLGRYQEAIKCFDEVENEIGPNLTDRKLGGSAYSVLQKSAWYRTKAENRLNAGVDT